MRYVELPEMLAASDVISFHCPLTPQPRHLIDADALARVKHGSMPLNTSRGAVFNALKAGTLGRLVLDVDEEEAGLLFRDLSGATALLLVS